MQRLLLILTTLALALPAAAQEPATVALSDLTRPHDYVLKRASSYDRSGGNEDYRELAPGGTWTLLDADGPGEVTHVWMTIASREMFHLKKLVLRMYWDGESTPSVEAPVGDFFGLGLGDYFLYQSAPLAVAADKALNAFFPMPFQKHARITMTNEGKDKVDAYYFNMDYRVYSHPLAANTLYFHAQYRQQTPNAAAEFASGAPKINLDGRKNYVYMETRGAGHLMGVTLGVVQNRDGWMGEGDDMIFIDNDSAPAITGTGSEDYFNGAWDFGGRDGALPFAHLYNGAPFIAAPELAGGRYCLYRWHADNPVTFAKSLRHTMEHGHANDRADCFYSVGYWYQSEPFTDFPAMAPVRERVPGLRLG